MGICENSKVKLYLKSGTVFNSCAVQTYTIVQKFWGQQVFFFEKKLKINSQQSWVTKKL